MGKDSVLSPLILSLVPLPFYFYTSIVIAANPINLEFRREKGGKNFIALGC